MGSIVRLSRVVTTQPKCTATQNWFWWPPWPWPSLLLLSFHRVLTQPSAQTILSVDLLPKELLVPPQLLLLPMLLLRLQFVPSKPRVLELLEPLVSLDLLELWELLEILVPLVCVDLPGVLHFKK